MKRLFAFYVIRLMTLSIFAQYSNSLPMVFNSPYTSANNRSVILPSDRIPSDFLGCTIGVTTEVDALKNLNRLGIRYRESSGGASDVLIIDGNIECEGARFKSVSLWFYNNIFWKIVFEKMETDSKILANIIKQKYSRFSKIPDKYNYIRYIGHSTDLVHNEYNLQYIIRGGSCTRLEE